MTTPKLLITGVSGYLGALVAQRISTEFSVLGVDIRPPANATFAFQAMDIRDRALPTLIADEGITHVLHLASVLESGRDHARDFDIDVHGTRNVLEGARKAQVRHLCVLSSGAAYGYHADNADWLDEDAPLRGHSAFSYAMNKRAVEELLARYRRDYPALKQLVFRPGTVLGATTDNLITHLFAKKRILTVQGSPSPFVFIWDEDVVEAILHGIRGERSGIYNLAGDGALSLQEIAHILGKPTVAIPPELLRLALTLGRRLGVGRYGPEQLDFLRYRPVLANARLKDEFGYTPRKTSEETFRFYVEHARADGRLC